MGLRRWLIKFVVAEACVLLTVKFNVVARVKNSVQLTCYANALLDTAMENLDALRIGGCHRKTGILEVCCREAVKAVFGYRNFIVGLTEIDPLVAVLGKPLERQKDAKKCKKETFHPGINLQHQFTRNIRKPMVYYIPVTSPK